VGIEQIVEASRYPPKARVLLTHLAVIGREYCDGFRPTPRVREREELAALDDRMLHNIGLTRADVYGEYGKSFWRI
jgi:uncharacterized protein YjiS (DUF1127 family)